MINPIVFLFSCHVHRDVIFFEFIIDKADAAKASWFIVTGFFFITFLLNSSKLLNFAQFSSSHL